ncbi:Rossmann-fold NAD(P)-binding domain-containing protein [Methylobacterium sp. CM6257]
MLRRVFRGRSEWKVISTVVAMLLLGEFSLSFAESRLSLDMQHVKEIPAIMRNFEAAPGPGVLFLGNSLTRAGIRTDVIESIWSLHGLPRAKFALIYPDDTSVLDWFYLYRRFVEPAQPRPRVLVICFALDQLADNRPVHSERLGSLFAGLPFLAEAFSNDVLSVSDRVRYLLAAVSRVWANRERVQTRVLALIPGYEALAQTLNEAANARRSSAVAGQPVTYARLARFIETVRKDGTDIIFVAIPLPKHYPLPEKLRRTIHGGGAELLNLQGIQPAHPGDYPDGYHMSPAAAVHFSASLGTATAASAYFRSALLGERPVNAPAPTASPSRLGSAVP